MAAGNVADEHEAALVAQLKALQVTEESLQK